MSSPLCIGHRGARGYLPENTLPSFQHAIDLGCDWIELDVYLVESELIVIHDKRVDRTTDGSGLLADLGMDYIRSLDAGGGAGVPTLREVLDLVDGRCGINVELKGDGTAGPVCRQLDEYCTNGRSKDAFLLSSFNHRELGQANPTYRRGALFSRLTRDMWEQAETLGAWSVNFDMRDVTPQLVTEAHERGYKVLVYTVNEPRDIKRMIACQVDGIFSDFPDRLLKQRQP
ncbi:MAG: glycerophosphodiester phosphodiesterase [Gammaproteobacteria bacterium]|jgi:glycerophosphoryl diester phosphodiesterase|nr:glycerophosphodiester phosphodiesterase [Gammaproteobacteria bacterium]MBT4492949.1 glycerophosphodiester phosphodiesterase [Gammaproteobacteria bacterium]MBT7372077.1 glycerophosphodiester phosphodiesterase [Gammaproteobacteria bacterium]